MKKLTHMILLMIGGALFVGCDDNKKTEEKEEKEAEVVVKDDQQKESPEQLTLNEGEKWKVNEEMMPYITKSEQMVNDFEGEDYQALAEDLLKLNNKLISSCTMKGTSHDQLHKWLRPHIELLKEFKAQDDPTQSAEMLEEIKDSFKVFHQYFK